MLYKNSDYRAKVIFLGSQSLWGLTVGVGRSGAFIDVNW